MNNNSSASMTNRLSSLRYFLTEMPLFWPSVALFFSQILISVAPILAKLCEQEIGPNAVAFHRSWIATIVFGLWSWGQGRLGVIAKDQEVLEPPPPLTRQEYLLLLSMGSIAGTSLLLWTWSLSQTTVANVALLSNLSPLFVGVAGYLFLGKKFDQRFVIGLIIAVVGAIFYELNEVKFSTEQLQGDFLALLSAVFLATYIILIEKLQYRFATATIMFWRCGITMLFILPVLPFIENRIFPHTGAGWFYIIFQALLCQTLGQGLLAFSLSKLSAGLVAITMLVEPPLASIFAWVVFGEQVPPLDWLIFAVILGGIYLAQSSKSAVKEAIDEA